MEWRRGRNGLEQDRRREEWWCRWAMRGLQLRYGVGGGVEIRAGEADGTGRTVESGGGGGSGGSGGSNGSVDQEGL